MSPNKNAPWSKQEFEKKLREKEKYYHINHEFHLLMNSGKLDKPAIQGWVANRFYYQVIIPVKDAAIMANCPDRDVRRHWIQRIIDHDGTQGDEGGIEAWLLLGEAVGLPREDLLSHKHLLPGVKFAIDAYVNFARQQPWEIAASSSLTELFAPTIHQKRLDNWPEYYPWIDERGYHYFRKRLTEARRDVKYGLDITLNYYKTREQQERMLEVLQFKLDILWTMLDCMWMAYVENKPPYHNIAS
ncbi:MAG: pyrroloquinoline quinone biosynthesis protein C [gamma proteobacterium symbiont of Stewartia floridana]|nr:pyrroloquinoline-quinone synthase PqqC [Candidatus Thiodiazotropha taylori]RLW55290.1 MAG: pyrroloquinoline quinone biosynthesis protein C [gamma proteobacterium symbiont of Stewartia floridana]MCG7894003.1 pyrroloquinoline-quinone synthase PqqC [Candidatus Thiodiazotropha taylori]MCG7905963.1 pyrroloquinoline-quinone synthase PqqC [Candidatus Thiodiazotropha taylori]MCG7910169.1 pyrroloquinoline-quinone synthase PqqC [Candidatus Thiodiazotropha taylori]